MDERTTAGRQAVAPDTNATLSTLEARIDPDAIPITCTLETPEDACSQKPKSSVHPGMSRNGVLRRNGVSRT